MASDEIRRAALARDLARRQAPLSLDALRLIDRWTLALQLHEQEHGPIDLLALRRMIPRFDPRAPVETAIVAALCAVGIELAIEDEERAELREAARDEMVPPVVLTVSSGPGGPYLLEPIDPPEIATGAISIMDADPATKARALDSMERECRRLTAESERGLRAPAVSIGLPGDDMSDRVVVDDPEAAVEFQADRLTENSPVPAAIARTMTPTLDEDPEPYDSLDLEWDVSDIHAGEGT